MSVREKFEVLDSKALFDYKTFKKFRRWTTVGLFTLVLIFYPGGYIFAPILAILYYNLFRVIYVDIPFEKYVISLENDAYSFFRLLSLSLEKGNSLDKALNLVDHATNGDLAKEFRKALIELRFGKDLKEVLVGLGNKLPSDMLKNIILSISKCESADEVNALVKKEVYKLKEIKEEKRVYFIKRIPSRVGIVTLFIMIPMVLLLLYGTHIVNIIN